MAKSVGITVASLLLAAAGFTMSRPAAAQQGLVVVANVQVRANSVPNSCDYSVFQPEIRITNTGDHPFFLPQAFVQVYFNAPIGSIQPVHPEGTTAAIFSASGAFKSWDTISIDPQAIITFPTEGPSPDRLANQAWRIFFGPINPPGRGPDVTLNPGDFAQFIVSFQRVGGLSPFDPQCDDFTKLERNSTNVFTDNKFYNLLFTQTQQLLPEFLNPTTPDPNTGIFP
jgi:hypothetical protein